MSASAHSCWPTSRMHSSSGASTQVPPPKPPFRKPASWNSAGALARSGIACTSPCPPKASTYASRLPRCACRSASSTAARARLPCGPSIDPLVSRQMSRGPASRLGRSCDAAGRRRAARSRSHPTASRHRSDPSASRRVAGARSAAAATPSEASSSGVHRNRSGPGTRPSASSGGVVDRSTPRVRPLEGRFLLSQPRRPRTPPLPTERRMVRSCGVAARARWAARRSSQPSDATRARKPPSVDASGDSSPPTPSSSVPAASAASASRAHPVMNSCIARAAAHEPSAVPSAGGASESSVAAPSRAHPSAPGVSPKLAASPSDGRVAPPSAAPPGRPEPPCRIASSYRRTVATRESMRESSRAGCRRVSAGTRRLSRVPAHCRASGGGGQPSDAGGEGRMPRDRWDRQAAAASAARAKDEGVGC
eukprot:scaffold18149_cov129-Isochrysis_galbana.AAC.2